MVPVVKGWSTEMSIDVASTGVQVHGGMGFIEETGAAQHYRDARILTIYEGTTAIQANDLIGRKTLRDGGAAVTAILAQVRATAVELGLADSVDLQAIAVQLTDAASALEKVVGFVLTHMKSDIKGVFSGSVPYLKLAGIVVSGWQMGRAALIADVKLKDSHGDSGFYSAKIGTARFFAEHFLSQASAYRVAIVDGHVGVMALADEQF
jgi:hypothetical protein